MASRPFIAVVGSANVDLTTFHDAFPKPGETIFGKSFDLGFGNAPGIPWFANPGPALPVDFAELRGVDYFIPNESEAGTITGMPVDTAGDAKECAQFLMAQGVKRVVITRGERGCLLASEEG